VSLKLSGMKNKKPGRNSSRQRNVENIAGFDS